MAKKEKKRKYNVTLTPTEWEKARRIGIKIRGEDNVSGMISYLIYKAK